MSTYVVVAFFLVSAGCVDPASRNDDFNERVVDAAIVPDRAVAGTADIGGWFFLTIDPKSLSPGSYLSYLAEVQMTLDGDNTTIDLFKLYPLDFETLEHVAPAVDPSEWTALPVDFATGTFTFALEGVVIPGRTNSILVGSPVTIDGDLQAFTIDEDFFCGELTGMVVETGSALDGSTFGAQRVGENDIGAALPAPVGACDERPDPNGPDAGVPDAGVPLDAPGPDAMNLDAMAPDAMM